MQQKNNNNLIGYILLGIFCIAEAILIGILLFNVLSLRETNRDLEKKVTKLEKKVESVENTSTDKNDENKIETDENGYSAELVDEEENSTEEAQKEEKPDLSSYKDGEAGQLVDLATVKGYEEELFYSNTIEVGDAVYNRIIGKSYVENPNVALEDLRYLRVLHYNFNHEVQIGELIVNKKVSENALSIFRELYDMEYEVQSMYLIDNYWMGDGDSSDTESIQNNNTSSFCYRLITGGNYLSNHAYGFAIDINPQQNPYIWYENGNQVWYHDNATPYVDRSCGDPHVIVKDDACYQVFQKYGYSWGGEWTDPIDYQHFEYLE